MAINPHARKVLDQQGIEVVRAKHIKEIAVTRDPKKEIAFGDNKVTLGDVEEWLSKKAKSDSRWIKVAAIAAVAAALIALLAWVFPNGSAWLLPWIGRAFH
jgi:hypothetical protein